MTFDDGTNSDLSSQPATTESLIRLLTQTTISIAIISIFLLGAITNNADAVAALQPLTLGVLGFWLGQSAVATWAGVQRSKIASEERRRNE
jgi:hypothetical protein